MYPKYLDRQITEYVCLIVYVHWPKYYLLLQKFFCSTLNKKTIFIQEKLFCYYPLTKKNLYVSSQVDTTRPPTHAREPSSKASNATDTHNSANTFDTRFVPTP